MRTYLRAAVGLARRWAHVIQVETWYVNQDGQTRVRSLPLDQVVVNRVVALILWALAFLLSVIPFGDVQATSEVIGKLLALAQEVYG